MIQLDHLFRYQCHEWGSILFEVNSIESVVKSITKHATKAKPTVLDKEGQDQAYRTYAGNAFEVFAEFFLKSHPFDNRVGITDYKPLQRLFNVDKDTGTDGTGIGTNNKPAAVQVKFKSNRTEELTANKDNLTNFTTSAMMKYGVDPKDTMNLLIVTSGKGLNRVTKEEMLQGKVRCLGFEDLSRMLDNNFPFWDQFRKSTEEITQKS